MGIRRTGELAFASANESALLDRDPGPCEAAMCGMENGHRRVMGPNFGGIF
jgi:hypothetical protein